MNKRTLFTTLKYTLALGLLTAVIWSNWGDSRRVAGKVVVGADPAAGMIAGTVAEFDPGHSITIEETGGAITEFALNRKTKFARPDGEPLPGGTVPAKGDSVSIAEGSRGLAYVWQKHVTEGKPIQYWYVLLAFLIFVPSILSTFFRWHYLVRAVDLPFRITDALRLGFVGLFFNIFLPGAVGGDIIKAAFVAREHKERRTLAVATVMMDRGLALWALVWFVAICGVVFWAAGLLQGEAAAASKMIIEAALGVVAVTLGIWLSLGLLSAKRADIFAGRLARLPKVGTALSELWLAVWMYRCRMGTVVTVMLISLAGHAGFVLTFFCGAMALWDPADSGQKIPSLMEHFLIVPIGMVIRALPGLPGGAGLGELGFGGLYGLLGCSVASGVVGALVYRLLEYVLGGVSGLLYLRMRATLPAEEPPDSSDAPDGSGGASGAPEEPPDSSAELAAAEA